MQQIGDRFQGRHAAGRSNRGAPISSPEALMFLVGPKRCPTCRLFSQRPRPFMMGVIHPSDPVDVDVTAVLVTRFTEPTIRPGSPHRLMACKVLLIHGLDDISREASSLMEPAGFPGEGV